MSRILDRELGAPRPDAVRPRLPLLFEPGLLTLQAAARVEPPDPTSAPRSGLGLGAPPAAGVPVRQGTQRAAVPSARTEPRSAGSTGPGPDGREEWSEGPGDASPHTPSTSLRTGSGRLVRPGASHAEVAPRTTGDVLARRTRPEPAAAADPPPSPLHGGPGAGDPAGPWRRSPAPRPVQAPRAPRPAEAVAATPAPVAGKPSLPPVPSVPSVSSGPPGPSVAAGPVVRISIGRIEVRAAGDPSPPASRGSASRSRTGSGERPAPRLGLAEYLDRRDRARGGPR